MTDRQIRKRIRNLVERDDIDCNLSVYSDILKGYTGAERAADILDVELCS